MSVTDWSPQPSGNAVADRAIPARDGMAGREVPGAIRGVMAKAAALALDQGGALLSTGTGNVYAVATHSGFAELKPGVSLSFTADRTNTGEPTLAVDGSVPRRWLDVDGSAFTAGLIKAGQPYTVVWVDAVEDGLPAWRTTGAVPGFVERKFADLTEAVAEAAPGTLPPAGTVLARPTVGKVRERRSLLDFIPASLHDAIADGTIPDTIDLSSNLAAAAAYAKKPRARLVIPSGVYPYQVSPNWAGNHVRVATEGEVRFRYAGTGVAFVADAGANLAPNGAFLAVPGKTDMQFGPLIIEAPATALNAAFIRAIHHSLFDLNIRGCGANSAALYMQFGVCSTVRLTVSGNQPGDPAADGSGGSWYKGAKPKIGLLLEARPFNGDTTIEPVSYCEFPRPIIEHVGQGAILRHSLGSQLLGGTIEGCTEFGARIEATAHDNTVHLVDFEANNGSDLYVAGKDNKVSLVNALGQKLDGSPNDCLVIDATAEDTKVISGKFNTIIVVQGAKRTSFDPRPDANRYGNGYISDAGVETTGSLYDVGAGKVVDLSQVRATGLSTPRILADWLKYPISLERFGCKGDFNGTTGTDNTAAFQRGLDSGEELRLSLGARYYLPQTGFATSNRPLSIIGQRGSALIFGSAVANGLTASAADYVTGIEIANLSLLTLAQEAGSAVSIALPAPDGSKPINNPSVALRNVIMAGLNSGQHGWRRGAYLLNCHSAPVEGCRVYGRQDSSDTTMARFTKMTEGFLAEYTGAPNISGAPRYRATTVVGAQTGIRAVGNAEGGEIVDCQIEAVLDGVLNEMSMLRPGFVVRGGHINATRRGIYLFRTANFKIADVLFYKFDKSAVVGYGALPAGVLQAGETVGIILDQCQTGTIGLNEYQIGGVSGGANSAGEWTAIRLKDTLYTTVERQNISLGTTGVSLTGGSANNDITPPSMYGDFSSAANPQVPVRDATSATSNFVRGSAQAVKNASAVTVAANSTFVEIARIDLGSPLAGSVFDITAAIEFGKGATAGLSLFQISALSGSVDFAGKGALQIRANQGASATDVGNASCPVRVTANGPTVLILQGLAQGSATTVAVNAATIAAARR